MNIFISRSAFRVATIFFLATYFQLRAQTNSSDITPQAILNVMQRVADWQLAHPTTNRPTGWICAAGDAGMMALAGISGGPKYRDAMLAMGETNDWQLPEYRGRKYHADDQCIGQTYAELYFLYRDPKMIAPLRKKFDFILANPSGVQSLDHAQPRAEELWSWCDSLFMAPPTWLRLYAATGDERYMNFALTNFWRTTDYLYDTNEHLFFRDSTYFDKSEANGEKIFWSRGNGWVIAGLVRMLQYLPMNHPDRPRFEILFKDMAEKVLTCQQPDGLWRSSLLDPEDYPVKETSGSGFFTYALAWGMNQGLLDRTKFEPAVQKAWVALVGCVDADGKLTHVQPVGADPKKFDADSTAPYGVGVFLLAGSEVYRMAAVETARERMILPVVKFENVPISAAIKTLANSNYMNIKYTFNPKLGYGQYNVFSQEIHEPIITFGLTNCTIEKAFYTLLDNYGLQLIENHSSGASLIATKSNDFHMQFAEGVRGWQGFHAVKITNLSSFDRNCETVELKFDDLIEQWGRGFDDVQLAVMDGLSSRILDSQIYISLPLQNLIPEKSFPQIELVAGNIYTNVYSPKPEQPQKKLLFQVDFAPHETRTFYILDAAALATTPPPIIKTFARYVPERYDDFAWESDRIAHRAYGLALIPAEHTISSAPDVWIKKDRGLIVQTMYATKHYHEDNGSFMDDYRVGHSRGDGGLGIWDGKKLHTSSNWKNWKLITTGPIRSEFELTYDAWDAGNGRMVSETKRYSIDAGSWFTKAQSTFNSDDKSPLTIGVGLAERACGTNGQELIAQNQTEGWMSYWQPEDKPKGSIGVAIVLPKGSVTEFTTDDPNLPDSKIHAEVPQPTHEGAPPIRDLLGISQAEIGKPFTYYFGACWDRSGDFTNDVQWANYVKRFAERRDQPLQVTIGN